MSEQDQEQTTSLRGTTASHNAYDETGVTETKETSNSPTSSTKQERRQDRREERARARTPENAAPANLFQKAKGSDIQSNPERVKIIKTHIREYAANSTRAHGDTRETKIAFNGIASVIRNMFTLNATEMRSVIDTLVSAIKNDADGAFSMGILYRYISSIHDVKERETFVSVMDLLTSYARLQDPAKIRTLKDVDFAVRYVRNVAAAKAFVGFFPSK